MDSSEIAEQHQMEMDKYKKRKCIDKVIICSESKWKSIFDIWVLFLVGYSCIASLYYVAFSAPSN